MDWYWHVDIQGDEIRLNNDDHQFTIIVRGDSDVLHFEQGSESWTMTAEQLAPAGRDNTPLAFLSEIREALFDGKRAFGEVRTVGQWTLLRSDEMLALKHRTWAHILATHGQSNGWLVSLDRVLVGFVHSSELRQNPTSL